MKYIKYALSLVFAFTLLMQVGIVSAAESDRYRQNNLNGPVELDRYPTPPTEMKESAIEGLNSGSIEARELKVQIREMVAQLLDVYPGESLQGRIAVPTTFVNLSNFNQTSDFGRYITEATMYEFNVRGYPVLEYRMYNSIDINDEGEFVLGRGLPNLSYGTAARDDVILVGTYHRDNNAVTVNARLVRPDGLVLRTAMLILPMNNMLARLTQEPVELKLPAGVLQIRGK